MTSNAKWSDLVSRDRARTIAAINELLPAWVSLIIVVLIGWQLAKIFWLLVPAGGADNATALPLPAVSQGQGNRGGANVQRIADASLFGKADPAEEPAIVEDTLGPVDETSLRQLTLLGTHASADENLAVAFIDGTNEPDQIFHIGDPVASGAKLHAVYPDRVILNERGALTSLSLPREYAESSPPVRRSSVTTRTSVTPGNQASIQQVVSQNVSRLSEVIRPTPYFVAGQQQGYRVYPGRDRQQFADLGLRPGDLIKEIDGQALTDPQQAMNIFRSLGSASQVSVTVERNGQPETIVLRTDQLDLNEEQTQ